MKSKLCKLTIILLSLFLCLSSVAALPDHQSVGCVDEVTIEAGKVRVRGWAYDPDHNDDSLEIQIYCDDEYLGSISSEFVRSDVNAAMSITGSHGYNGTVPVSKSGEHTIYVYALDEDSQSPILIGSKQLTFMEETLSDEDENEDTTDNILPAGKLDELKINENGKLYCKGWAFDQDTSDEPVTVEVDIDEVLYDTFSTDFVREDVNSTYSIEGSHGFENEFVTDLQDIHTVEFYMLDSSTNEKVLLDSQSINFTASQDETADPDMPFVDVPQGKWYYDYIVRINQEKLMTGLDETHFGPADNMTRGMVATVLYRMAGSPEITYQTYFDDVLEGKYYSNPITWCYENGIISNSNSSFRPRDLITRQELAIMLRNIAGYMGVNKNYSSDLSDFPDASNVSYWAYDAMSWAVENKLISGDQGYLNPKNNATRAQCAKMLLAVYDLIKNVNENVTATGSITNLSISDGILKLEGTAECSLENYSVQIYLNNKFSFEQAVDETSHIFNVEIPVDERITKVEVYVTEDTYNSSILIDSKSCNSSYQYAIDTFKANSNNLVIGGWIYDINNTDSTTQLIVKANGEQMNTFSTDLTRDDVNLVYKITGEHGFNPNFEMEDGSYTIAIYALDDFGNEIELASKELEFKYVKEAAVLSGEVENYKVSLNQITLAGTVSSNQDCEIEAAVYGNDVLLGNIAVQKEEDQYIFNGSVSYDDTISKLEVYVKETDCEEKTLIASYSNVHDPIMCLDAISVGSGIINLTGWAYDEDDLDHVVEIHLYQGDNYLGKVETSSIRTDVNSKFGITGNHGFSGTIQADLEGNQTISIYVVDVLGNENFYTARNLTLPEKVVISKSAVHYAAHRGYSSIAPENTVRSFTLAGEAGFWGCETDVYITADEEFICYHNPNFSNITNSSGTPGQKTLAQIKQIKITGGNNASDYANDPLATTIPTLEEYLTVCSNYSMVPVIEIKNGSISSTNLLTTDQIKKLYDTVHSIMGGRQVYFIAFDLDNLINMRNYMNSVGDDKTVLLYLTYNPNQVNLDNLENWNIGMGAYYGNISQSMVNNLHNRNLKVNVWTVSDAQKAETLISYGVDSITSDIQLWNAD